MSILSKFNRICFNYSCRLSSNEHAAAFVDEVRQMIQEHEQLSPAPAEWIRQVKLMLAYAEAMGFWVVDDEMSVDDIFANLDRIAAQFLPAPAWQPIATAPKDGTEIFVCNADGYQREIVFWDSDPNDLGWHTTDGRSFYKYAGDAVYWHSAPEFKAPPQADEVCECGGTGSIPRGLDMWDRMNGEEIPCPKCTGKAAEADHV